METSAEAESQWQAIAGLKTEVSKFRLNLERLELVQSGTYDAVLQLVADQKTERADLLARLDAERVAREEADQQIATRAADAIVEALRSRLDNRVAIVAALTSVTAQTLSSLWISLSHR